VRAQGNLRGAQLITAPAVATDGMTVNTRGTLTPRLKAPSALM
jgi:hypothetical protein